MNLYETAITRITGETDTIELTRIENMMRTIVPGGRIDSLDPGTFEDYVFLAKEMLDRES
jgi:hypothetical protein